MKLFRVGLLIAGIASILYAANVAAMAKSLDKLTVTAYGTVAFHTVNLPD